MDRRLDLNEHLAPHPDATFFARAAGESMLGAGIHDGDLLVIDRSETARSGKVVVVALDGELTVKRFVRRGERLWLEPENPDYDPLEITGRDDVTVWGVVTYVVHAL